MKKYIAIAAFITLSSNAIAQAGASFSDILTPRQTGTARAMGMGGAYGAVGADLGGASFNPAGLGLYKADYFIITPQLNFQRSNTSFIDTKTRFNKTNFGFGNFGIVKGRDYDNSKLKSFNWSLSFNRDNSYARSFAANGVNKYDSYSHFFTTQANDSGNVNRNDTYLMNNYPNEAYLASLVGLISNLMTIDYMSPVQGGGVRQTIIGTEKGNQLNYSYSMAFNIDDKFYLGGSIGWQNTRYRGTYAFKETDVMDTIPIFTAITHTTNYSLTANGFVLNLGGIYQVNDNLRLGISYKGKTPTKFSQSQSASLSYDFKDDATKETFNTTKNSSPVEQTFYMRLPSRLTFSGCYLFDTRGLVSLDVDYNFSQNTAFYDKNDPFKYETQNELLKNTLTNTMAFRAGGEYRINKKFIGRAGFNYYQTPSSDNPKIGNLLSGSLGLTYKGENDQIDIALVNTNMKYAYQQYVIKGSKGSYTATSNVSPFLLMVTLSSKI